MTGSDKKQPSLLTFRVGPVLCCAPSLPVRSIITPPRLTHPPGSDDSQPGIFRHDGHIVKVIDLRQKFGVDKAEQTHPGNLIICHFSGNHFAFWVDQILDVFDFPAEGWGNLPAAIPRGVFSRTLLLNKKIHLYSEFEKLCSIHDLGYLKHYIQQLRQEQNNTQKIPAGPAANISESSTLTHAQPGVVAPSSPAESTAQPKSKIQPSTTTASVTNSHPVQTRNKMADRMETHANLANTLPAENIKQVKKTSANTSFTSATSRTPVRDERQNPVQTTAVKNFFSESKQPQTIVKPAALINNRQYNEPVQYSASLDNDKNKRVAPDKMHTFTTVVEDDTPHSEESSGSVFIILFVVILLSVFSASLYYVLFHQSGKQTIYQPVVEKPTSNSTSVPIEKEPMPVESELLYSTENIQSLPGERKYDSATTGENDNNQSTAIPGAAQKPNVSDYHAEITQQDNEITITVNNQAIENVTATSEQQNIAGLNLSAPEKNTEAETAAENTKTEAIKKAEINPVTAAKAIPAKIITKEIIHVVVKGDTLWAIANKYVNNPFLYPELARLSNIKNPHRIYPGNRVKIRFINN